MGNVIAIGLTPSRTGIAIGRLLNAQLRHMSVRAAWRRTAHCRCVEINTLIFLIKINLYFGHRHAVGKLHYTVWFYKVCWSFPSHFPSLLNTLLMPVRILLLISFQVNCLSITYDTFSAINMGL